MLCLAIDENGYGPIMGPLVVTGVLGTSDVHNWAGDIYDSKKLLYSRTGYEKIEMIALSVFKISTQKFPENVFEVFENFQTNNNCKEKSSSICFKNLPEIPFWTSKERILEYCEYFSELCDKQKIKIVSLNSLILCAGGFNKLCRNGLMKDFINYLIFEKIILHTVENCDNLLVMAGKIGGRKTYDEFLKNGFSDWKILENKKNTNISEYLLKKNSSAIDLNFIRDIESKSFLGVLAGIYGKYVRELFMVSINKSIGSERHISGYRDIHTKSFLKHLVKEKLQTDCLLRIK